MRTWSRSDRIALFSLIVGAVGSVAGVIALWGPFNDPGTRGAFRIPTVEWQQDTGDPDFPGVEVAFNAWREVVGFKNVNSTSLDGCSGPGSGVFTVREVTHADGTTLINGIIVEDASGDHITFAISPYLGSRMRGSSASWIKAVFAKDRRVLLSYWACGTAMLPVTEVLAE